ncbi:hypothetical protein NESM_000428300 [Novymonas esmeraldas]|uniref:Uncharacterized protein n=1 Tax=Novymonas esmeraldas TaxID=1808958 RepID=A0AAW0ELR1_9TRYP
MGKQAAPLTRLEAHAAVRLDALAGALFDSTGLPLRRTGAERHRRFSLAKCVKGLASYLTTRINPSFQECLVRVVESEAELTFEVAQLSGAKGANTRRVFAAPLSRLVDVVSNSVIERDTVVFAHLPSSLHPAAESGDTTTAADALTGRPSPPVAAAAAAAPCAPAVSRKEEIISTLFSAYGDIGLHLVFRAAHRVADSSRRSSPARAAAAGGTGAAYTRVELRFVSADERNAWLSFCADAYLGLLLDSIRTNRDTVFVAADGDGAIASAAAAGGDGAVRLEKPSEEAVENFIDFFLSAAAKGDAAVAGGFDPLALPSGGHVRVRDSDGTLHSREAAVERVDGVDEAGMPVVRTFFVVRRKRWSGKQEVLRIALESLHASADDDLSGAAFYLEYPRAAMAVVGHAAAAAAGVPRTTIAEQLRAVGAVQQTFAGSTDVEGEHAMVTLECDAGSFAVRRQWLEWFEAAVGRPVIYLSVARRERETAAPVRQGQPSGLLGDRIVW